MNKISGSGHFRCDGAQPRTQSVMTVDAVLRAGHDQPSAQAISITIHEKLPLMNGQSGCEVEVQLTPDQAAHLAHRLFEMVGQAAPAAPAASPTAPTPANA